MELIDQFFNGRFPIKMTILAVLLIIFIAGIGVVMSGVKQPAENKSAKIISIILGITMILVSFVSGIYVILFGFNS